MSIIMQLHIGIFAYIGSTHDHSWILQTIANKQNWADTYLVKQFGTDANPEV